MNFSEVQPTFKLRSRLKVAQLTHERARAKSREKSAKSREKIVALLAEDGTLSAAALAVKIGISAKAIKKHLASLSASPPPKVDIGR